MPADGRPGGFVDDRRVHHGERRALLEEPAVDRAPRGVALQDPPDLVVRQSRRLLQHPDGECLPPHPGDSGERCRFVPGHLRVLPAAVPVDCSVEACCRIEVLPGRLDPDIAVCLLPLPLQEPEGRVALDQVEEHRWVPAVRDVRELDPPGEGDPDEDPMLLHDRPERPAGRDIRVVTSGWSARLRLLEVLEHAPVLLGRVVDPDRQHPVHHLVVTRVLDLREPPDAPLGYRTDPELPVGRDGPVLDGFVEGRGGRLQNLLQVVGERGVVEEDHRPRPEVVGVVERLVRDGAGEFVVLRDEVEHCGAGVALPFAGVAGDGDVQSPGVCHRLRGDGHDQALRDGSVANVAPVEGIEEERERIAGPKDLDGTRLMFILDENGRRKRRQLSFFLRDPGPLRLIPLPEFRPALRSPAATCVVTTGEDGTVCKLDRERPVLVGRRERAFVEDVEGAALVRPRAPDGDAVVEEPGGEVDAGAVAVRSLPFRGLFPGEERREMLQILLGHHADLVWDGEDLRPPVRPLRGVVALPGERTVKFPDPGGVVVRGVDGHGLVREEGVEGRKRTLHDLRCRLVVREIHPVEEVGAVARVGPDRLRESLLREVCGDPLRSGEGGRVLVVRGRDPARPNRIDVDREPAPADDVGVGGGGILPGEPHLDPVRPPGEEGRVHRVEGDVDPGDRRIGVKGLHGPGEGVVVIEVAGVSDAIGECPDLDHATVRGKAADSTQDLAAHPVTPGTRGKRGAEMASPRATRWKLMSGMM